MSWDGCLATFLPDPDPHDHHLHHTHGCTHRERHAYTRICSHREREFGPFSINAGLERREGRVLGQQFLEWRLQLYRNAIKW